MSVDRVALGWKDAYTMQCSACGVIADGIVHDTVPYTSDCLHERAKRWLKEQKR